MTRAACLALAVLAACSGDVDEAWFLDHDRIIAVRATPPRLASGETATLEALLGKRGEPPSEAAPPLVTVVAPAALAGVLRADEDRWVITAPDEATLAAARARLGLAADTPIPVQLGVAFPAAVFPSGELTADLTAIKTVWLGVHADNPTLTGITIDGVDGHALDEIVAPPLVDVPLAIDADERAGDNVNWLTSCGTMHDFDLPGAFLRVEEGDPTQGTLGVVLRRDDGGVAWRLWPVRTAGDQ